MDLRLHIEHLVIDGIAMTPGERQAFTRSTQAELTRLIGAGGIGDAAARGVAVPSVDGGVMSTGGALDPISFGRDLARAVYGGICEVRR